MKPIRLAATALSIATIQVLGASHTPGQSITNPSPAQTLTSPNGEYLLQTDNQGNFEIVNTQGQIQGQPVTPLRTNYEATKNAWSPDSTKVALIAMLPNLRDLYLLGIVRNYTVPQPPLEDLRQLAITKAGSTLLANPKAYKFFPIGPIQTTWLNSNQLQIESEYSLVLPTDFQAGGTPDIRQCIFSYVYDVTNGTTLLQLQLLALRKSPYS